MDFKKIKEAALGGLLNNPVFVLVLGICPTIAMSSNIKNAFFLGAATAFVLVFSNMIISALRKIVPDRVRLPIYLIIVSTFTIIVQLTINSFMPELNKTIGAFIPLIVVNCIILARAESYAGKNSVGYAAIDGLSMGLGFILAITVLGAIREGLVLIGLNVFGSTAGGFIVLGLLMALINFIVHKVGKSMSKKANKQKQSAIKKRLDVDKSTKKEVVQ